MQNRIKKNHSGILSSDDMLGMNSKLSEAHDETETTMPDDDDVVDDVKYGYNTYDDMEQECSEVPPPPPPSEHQRMPRRSSLRCSNGSTPRQSRRHSLTFATNVTVATITPQQELAKKKALWFEEKEYNRIQKKIYLIAERVKQGGEESRKHCTRGLESIIGRNNSETRRYAAWDAVLGEQEYQRQFGVDRLNDDALSSSYREATGESREEATIRGLEDEKAVVEYLSETRKYCRRMSM